jgi:hypothetical protein
MADITKCQGTDCGFKKTCYRFTANADPQWQSYFHKVPLKDDGTCNNYWQVGKKIYKKEDE